MGGRKFKYNNYQTKPSYQNNWQKKQSQKYNSSKTNQQQYKHKLSKVVNSSSYTINSDFEGLFANNSYHNQNYYHRGRSISFSGNYSKYSLVFLILLMLAGSAYANATVSLPTNAPLIRLDSPLTTCTVKSDGVSAGKLCTINNNLFVLKALEQPKELHVSPDMLQGFQNLNYLKKSGISVPENTFIYEPSGTVDHSGKTIKAEYYLGSKFEKDFTPASKISKRIRSNYLKDQKKGFTILSEAEYTRETYLSKISGEKGLAQLAVCGTIFYDITNNGGNWGFANSRLMIIDADLSPKSAGEYHTLAGGMPVNLSSEFKLYFSIETLTEMQSIYEDMLTIHQSNQFSEEIAIEYDTYGEILNSYVDIITKAIKKFENDFEYSEPTIEINQYLSKEFHQQGILFRQSLEEPETTQQQKQPETLFKDQYSMIAPINFERNQCNI